VKNRLQEREPMQLEHSNWVDEVVSKYADMVFRIAFTHTKSQSNADDIFQEVFLRLCKSKVVFETDEHVKAWLIKVTVNASRKFFTSAYNKNTIPLLNDADLSHKDTTYDAEIIEVVKSLPLKYRTVIHLFYFEDMAIRDISKALKIKETTIKSQLSRARNLLKTKLKGGFTYVW